GVATDVCNDAAIRGLLERELRVRFVEDAARGLDEERTAACMAAWREGGVEFTTVDEVVAALTSDGLTADERRDASRLADARDQPGCSDLAADRFLRHPRLPDLADDAVDAAGEAARDRHTLR